MSIFLCFHLILRKNEPTNIPNTRPTPVIDISDNIV